MCPEHGKWPWDHHKVGDQHYCYTTTRELTSNWDDAQAMCNELGAGLVTIHSAEENAFVEGFIPGAGQGRWLGLTTNYKERNYRWVDGTEMGIPPYLSFENADSSARPITSPKCICMSSSSFWIYDSCYNTRSFTCKTPTPLTGKRLNDTGSLYSRDAQTSANNIKFVSLGISLGISSVQKSYQLSS